MNAVAVDRRTLGEIVQTISVRGHQLTTDAYRSHGRFPIVDQGQSETCGFTDEPLAIEAPLPLIVFGDHTREVKFIEQPFVVGADGVKLLSPANPDLSPEYLFQLVKLAVTRLNSRGYARHFADLCQIGVPVIRDKVLRVKVARALGDGDSLTRAICRLIETKRTFKRGLMQQLLTGQKRFPEFRNSKWQSVALGDLIRYTPRKVPKPPGTFLSAGVRSHGKGVFLKKEFLSNGIALEELFELKHRDLVVNITFGWEGAVAIVPPEADGALVSHRFPTYEVDEKRVLVEYLRHLRKV
jgi:hypothetical protein